MIDADKFRQALEPAHEAAEAERAKIAEAAAAGKISVDEAIRESVGVTIPAEATARRLEATVAHLVVAEEATPNDPRRFPNEAIHSHELPNALSVVLAAETGDDSVGLGRYKNLFVDITSPLDPVQLAEILKKIDFAEEER